MNNKLTHRWVECSLGDVVEIKNGYAFPSREFRNSGVPLIRQGNLAGDKVSLEKCVYLDLTWLNKKPDFIIRKSDMLIGMSGSVGKLCVYDLDTPALQNQRIGKIVLRLPELAIGRYIWEYLKTVENQLLKKGKGLGVLNVSADDIESLPLRLPPISLQNLIVAKLEKLLDKVEACQKRLNKIPATLRHFRQSVLAAACSGRLTADWRNAHIGYKPDKEEEVVANGLPDLPETWYWSKLPNTGEMSRGKSRHRPRNAPFLLGGSYPFIQTGDIAQSGGQITCHKQTYSEAGLAQSRLWPEKTVCITIAANIAESALLTYPACFPDSVVGIIADGSKCLPEYLEFFIRTAKSDLSTFAPATAQKNINIRILSDLLVPLPPVIEQQEIVRCVEALFKIADQIETRYQKAKAYVDKLTHSILAKSFRGELVPQDPNDEPADELLRKIAGSRETFFSHGKSTRKK